MKIIITGSTGFIGSHLVPYFAAEGHTLVLLSRKPDQPHAHYWNPEKKEIDPSILKESDLVINLSGENILGRWTPKKMEQIRNSRLHATQFLCDTLLSLTTLPKLYIGASAIGFYGNRPREVLDESSPPGQGFLADVCKEWEKIPAPMANRGVRVTLSRFGIVLGKGGALKQIEKAFKMGMGGTLGSGEQIMSWIAIDDLCRAFSHIISHPELVGPINMVAPESLTNMAFTQTLGKVLQRPTIVPVPKFALSMLFGQGADIFFSSTDVRPRRLLESGFSFKYPHLEEALKKYLLG